MMKNILKSSLIMLLVDVIYLGVFAAKPFVKMVEKIQKSSVDINYLYAGITYVIMMIAFNHFILSKNGTYKDAFLLGMVIYGVFDFTNLALFKQYNIFIGIQDTIWGGLLFMITLYLTKNIGT